MALVPQPTCISCMLLFALLKLSKQMSHFVSSKLTLKLVKHTEMYAMLYCNFQELYKSIYSRLFMHDCINFGQLHLCTMHTIGCSLSVLVT